MKSQISQVKEKLKKQGIEIDEDSLFQRLDYGRKELFVKFKENGIDKELSIADFILKYLPH